MHRGVLDAGMPFVAKPYSADALLTRLRQTLDAGPTSGGEGSTGLVS